jgi:hypothetical protein
MDESQENLNQEWAGEETHDESEINAEVERLKAELQTKEDALSKWKARAKKGYEKQGQSQSANTEDIRQLVRKELEAEKSEREFLNRRPDASEKRADIQKMSSERWLSLEEAYKLTKFDEVADRWYQARSTQSRYWVHGDIGRQPEKDDELPDVYKQSYHRNKRDVFGLKK